MADYSRPETAQERLAAIEHERKLKEYGLKEYHGGSIYSRKYYCATCDVEVHSFSDKHRRWHESS